MTPHAKFDAAPQPTSDNKGGYTDEHKGGYKQINKALNICAFEDYLDTQLSRLPAIADVEVLSPIVIRVLGQNAGKFTLQGTNTYIIGTGSRRMLIDTSQGLPEWAALISSTIANLNITLSHVFLTHWHGDHTGGVPDLLRMYPHLERSIYKNDPSKNQQPIPDGSVFSVEGATLRAVHAPGHADDHTCFILEEEMAMFTGDNVLGHGTAAVEQLSVWLKSLRLMQSHNCKVGYPAHGVVIPDLRLKIDLELKAKTRRETQVLRALAKIRTPGGKASVTVKQLVSIMHGNDLNPEVRQMAIEPMMGEVLNKLAEDGKVAFEIRHKEKKWFTIL
ncbi:putative metallo-beta-lactamase domain protein [Plenodomus tracheiphilus IPT5]|uniref:Putative metallo-beta-lactamase domain protein n=1 Tax=Plenodomus tracheiphilus IPT5 TaxID=1408161 RepID=A0A6A7ARK8_9PLEO|nr:putative metallo-beta-lactamase domain protein [Plenodomus tracheiphilus IPT5]